MLKKLFYLLLASAFMMASCKSSRINNANTNSVDTIVKTAVNNVDLPQPYATPSVRNNSKVIGWPEGKTPVAPAGFNVTTFADGLDNPRWMYVAPNGDIFVAEANTVSDGFAKTTGDKEKTTSKNSILLLRDADHNGEPEIRKIFMTGLNRPFGMLILNNQFYVANTDAVWMYPYKEGQIEISGDGKKILDLPAGGYNNHWTRNLLASPDGSKIYVTVGSGSNVAEHGIDNEKRRADILEINPDGTGEKIYASGLRNPVGLGWAPGTNTLWTAVNERDALGDDLVPDYTTSVTEGAFYGWPYSYFGKNEDPRRKGERPDLVAKAIVPDVPLGAHTASLGLAFDDKNYFKGSYSGGLFVAQHGSWNRSELSGYKVVFVPFSNGKPSGPMQDFLTGFIVEQNRNRVYGRPVGVVFANDGSMLITDDASDRIWRIAEDKK
ncbi:MAG: sorbosone dehydrogenase family protein [Ginsengibacter sp.]